MNPLNHTPILIKALIIVALTLIPIGFLLNALMNEKDIAINFGRDELGGSRLVALSRDIVTATAQTRQDALNGRQGSGNAAAAFEKFSKEAGQSKYLSAETLAATGKAVRDNDHGAALSQLQGAISEVGDRSNLTLDPDVDTYYLMDVATVKVPNLIKVMSDIHAVALAAATANALTNEQRIQLFVLKGQFEDTLGGIATERDKAFAGTTDSNLQKNAEGAYKLALDKSKDFFSDVESHMLGTEFHAESPTALNGKYTDALYAVGALWQMANAEMDRLIERRVGGFEDSKHHSMIVTAALLVGTLAILFVITGSITRPLSRVVKALEEISKEHTDVTVAGTNRKDEIGSIARAAEKLRVGVAEAFRLKQMLEDMPTSIMVADPKSGFKVSYTNRMARETLKGVESHLPTPVDRLLGADCAFVSSDPSGFKNAVSNHKTLPRRERTKIGNELFDVSTSAMNDKKGDYIGAMVTWTLATKQAEVADNIERMVTQAVEQVAGSANQIGDSAISLNRTADETKQLSTAVAAASAQAAQTSSQVAASAEELTASISEISSKIQHSSKVATEAANKGAAINDAMKSLADKANRVGEVVNVITGIAEQTNLLALNATIEAARAGEAGKGFAVVASEVKSLANQTAKATEEVTNQITEMQGATDFAVNSVKEIMTIIGEISANTTAVAAAVEEQSAATNEIARNIAQTATGTQEISENIVSVERGAEDTGKTSSVVKTTVGQLNQQIGLLQDKIRDFLQSMRTAA
jgi:methyl-accepting chemotaxis protein